LGTDATVAFQGSSLESSQSDFNSQKLPVVTEYNVPFADLISRTFSQVAPENVAKELTLLNGII
jgi:hypothetical protein